MKGYLKSIRNHKLFPRFHKMRGFLNISKFIEIQVICIQYTFLMQPRKFPGTSRPGTVVVSEAPPRNSWLDESMVKDPWVMPIILCVPSIFTDTYK